MGPAIARNVGGSRRLAAHLVAVFLQQTRDGRLLVAAAGTVLLMVAAAVVDSVQADRRSDEAAEQCAAARRATSLEQVWVARMPSAVSFVSGDDRARGAQAAVFRPWSVEVHRGVDQLTAPAAATVFDWYWTTVAFTSVVLLLSSHDAISGEREARTLGMALVGNVGRSELVLAKVLGLGSWGATVCLVGLLANVGMAAALGRSLALADAPRVAAAAGFSLLMVLLVVQLGVLCSASSRQSQGALVAAVGAWVALGVVVPATLPLAAEALATGARGEDVRDAEASAHAGFDEAVTLHSSALQDVLALGLDPDPTRARIAALEAELRLSRERAISDYERELGSIRTSHLVQRRGVVELARTLRPLSPFAIYRDALAVCGCAGDYGALRFVDHARARQPEMTATLLAERSRQRAAAAERNAAVTATGARGEEYLLQGLAGVSYAGLSPTTPLGGCAATEEYCALDAAALGSDLLAMLGWSAGLLLMTIWRFSTADVR